MNKARKGTWEILKNKQNAVNRKQKVETPDCKSTAKSHVFERPQAQRDFFELLTISWFSSILIFAGFIGICLQDQENRQFELLFKKASPHHLSLDNFVNNGIIFILLDHKAELDISFSFFAAPNRVD